MRHSMTVTPLIPSPVGRRLALIAIPNVSFTFVVVFLTSGAVCANGLPVLEGRQGPGLLVIALAAGASWAATLALTARTGGGYLNPAITVTLWVFQKLEHKKVRVKVEPRMRCALKSQCSYFVRPVAIKDLTTIEPGNIPPTPSRKYFTSPYNRPDTEAWIFVTDDIPNSPQV